MKLRIVISLLGLACSALAGPRQDAAQLLATAPLRFEPAADGADTRFVARGARFRFEFSEHQALLRAGDKSVRLEFQGAARRSKLEGSDLLRSKTSLFLGNDRGNWRTAIPNFGRLEEHGVYPGIDLVYYGNAGELEYDLKVRPGADPKQIRLRLHGERAQLDREGNLVSELIQKHPVAYQIDDRGSRVAVESEYKRNRDGSYGFKLGRYDRQRELVIDPVLTLSAYLAGSFQDVAFAIGRDAIGFLYVAGTTNSNDFGVTSDARQATFAGAGDLFVAKIDPNAAPGSQVVYATYLGGTLADNFGGMAVGPKGDIYLTGTTLSADFPTVNPYQTALSSGSDAFVVWIDSSQNLSYATYLGGGSLDGANAIALDAKGRLWITGGTQSDDFPIVSGFKTTRAGSQDIFIAGFDLTQTGTGTLIYSTYLGGGSWETGRGIAVALDGSLWVVGGTYSFDYPVVGNAYQKNSPGGGDACLAHVNPAFGADGLLYSGFLGGSDLDEARSVVVDPLGRVIVSGYTVSTDFPVTPDALQPKYGGNTDVFVSILNPVSSSAQLVYSTYFGGAGADAAFDLKRDSNGILYLAGMTLSPGLPTNAGSLQAAYDGSMDAFVLRLNPNRAGSAGLDYFSYLGSDGLQVAYAINVDATGKVYLAGSTSGPIFDPFSGAQKFTNPGNTDAFVAGFNTCTFALAIQSAQFPEQGGTGTIGITAQQTDCSWTASSGLDWVTVAPASGSASGSVTLTVAANKTGAARQGNILIAGVSFLVGQDQ